jgi:hypothetical protein
VTILSRPGVRRLAVGTAAATALLGTILAPVASAAEGSTSPTASATVIAGGLSVLANDITFADTPISGAAATTTAALTPFQVNDLTGTGAGWTLTVQADALENDEDNDTLAADAMTITGVPTPTPVDTASGLPTVPDTVGQVVGTGGVTIATAAEGDGMGIYQFDGAQLKLALPADVYAGTYSGTVTFTASSGPDAPQA